MKENPGKQWKLSQHPSAGANKLGIMILKRAATVQFFQRVAGPG
jgi:hypothetical protein